MAVATKKKVTKKKVTKKKVTKKKVTKKKVKTTTKKLPKAIKKVQRAPVFYTDLMTVDPDIDTTWWTYQEKLWKKLVPKSGKADTIQGEVIRISERLAREAIDNGCMNWDKDWEKMLAFLLSIICDSKFFSKFDIYCMKQAAKGKRIKGKQFFREMDCDILCKYSVIWVQCNPALKKLTTVHYHR